ncbi:hypothetical protein [Porphyromonas sp. COT-108 OH1349]|uniref:hypothetical protein n=1 Tax=Porphyromonas sp. COT-108 OH1349 TaxID=1537504 RepID=UPI00126A3030|nr:hypothetical protein [Porphyromonas sp. COT-108 OH1349]
MIIFIAFFGVKLRSSYGAGECNRSRLPLLLVAKLGLRVQLSRASGGARKTREKAGKGAG